MRGKVDAQAREADAFALETEALFEAHLAGTQNLAARADDALPRDGAVRRVQRPGALAGRARKAGGVGDIAVGGHLAVGDAADLGQHLFKHPVHGSTLAQNRRKRRQGPSARI